MCLLITRRRGSILRSAAAGWGGRGGGAGLTLHNIVAATPCETDDRHCCLMYSPRNTKRLILRGKYIFPPAIEGVSPHAINLHGEAWLHPLLTFSRRNYFFLILAHPVYKMWIIQEPNTLELWNKLHFEERKNGECIPCLKYSVPIFVE